jgi:hypothetical protein
MKKAACVNIKKRPPVTGTLVGVRFQPDDLQALDVWRHHQADDPTRPEAIRRLLLPLLGQDKKDAKR